MLLYLFFFFNDTATTEIYTLSLHDALPILTFQKCQQLAMYRLVSGGNVALFQGRFPSGEIGDKAARSEEHTSELQSRQYLVCRLLLEKKKKIHCLQSLNNINISDMSRISPL